MGCAINVTAQPITVKSLGLKAPATISCTPVKDQYLSATCWSFSSVSFLESEFMKKTGQRIDLSEMFIARYSMLRKIKKHLAVKGSNFFTPGGQFHDAVWVISNYGIVPEAVYNGKARGETNHDHGEMDTLIAHFVNDCVSKGITVMDKKQEGFIDSVLDHYYGKIPASFYYKGTKYSPLDFSRSVLGFKPGDYVEITSYTHHPFYKQFVFEDKYNWSGDLYWNVPLADFTAITQQALKDGYTVGWDGDAQDSDFDFNEALAYLSFPVNDFTKERQTAFEDESTLLDHMMHIAGMVKDNQQRTWYYIKNSWGDYSNPLGGFLFMRDDYFKLRTSAIIVNKKTIPLAIKKKMGLK